MFQLIFSNVEKILVPPFADFENGSVSATTLADNSLRITWNVSNSNWDIFRVSINDQLYAEVAETGQTSFSL